MRKEIYLAMSAIFACFAVVVPAHPDDLIPCFGTCLLSKDVPRDSCHSSSRFRGRARPSSRKCRRRGDEATCVSRARSRNATGRW